MPVTLNASYDFPVGNAAGWCKSVAEVQALAKSAASFIVVGSITLKPRDGNPGNVFNQDLFGGLNALGLPNPGIPYIAEHGREMTRIAHDAGKPIIMSAAGLAPAEFGELAQTAHKTGFDGVELNTGCPNVADGGKRKPIISYRPGLVLASLESVFSRIRCAPHWFVSVKVSPMDPDRLNEIAAIIEKFEVSAVVTQNAEPNCLDYRADGKPVIDTPDKIGYAGGSGESIFHKALGQVKQWRECLPEHIETWGVGGVSSGFHVQKMQWAGARIMQVGTAYFIGGAKVFGEIANQYVNLEG